MGDQLKDGLPRSAYAYAPTADPSTWKLPFRDESGAPDPDHLPGAAAAISESGFRGQKADIPEEVLPAVRAKLRQAYKQLGKSPDEYPTSVREADSDVENELDRTLREAHEGHYFGAWSGGSGGHPVNADHPSARAPFKGGGDTGTATEGTNRGGRNSGPTNIDHPNLPQFQYPKTQVPHQDAAATKALLDTTSVGDKIELTDKDGNKVTGTVVQKMDQAIGVSDPSGTTLVGYDRIAAVHSVTSGDGSAKVKESDVGDAIDLAEVGKRNSGADQGRIQAAHDALMAAGAKCSHDNVDPMDGDSDAENAVDQVKEAWAFDDKAKSHVVAFHESGGDSLLVTLAEAGAVFDDATKEVWITPIRPGFGNPRDARYYPVDTVREAVEAGTFNNRKMYANHPTKREEGDRPERDVRDWVGVIRETKWDAGRGVPRSRVQVLDDSVYAKWKAAPDHVSFSVLGKGKARDGRVGNRSAQIVESIARINSVDWVTEAGAGGSIDFAEADYEESDMDFASMTPAQRAAALAELQTAIREAGDEDDKDEGKTPGDTATPKATEPNEPTGGNQGASKGGSGTASSDVPEGAAPSGFVKVEDFEQLQKQVAAMKVREAAIEGKSRAQSIATDLIRESGLPIAARDYLTDRFRESAVGEGFGYADDEAFKADVEKEINDFRRVAEATGIRRPSNVKGLGNAGDTQPQSLRESLESDIDGRLGRDVIPFREANETGVVAGQPSKGTSAGVEARIASRA